MAEEITASEERVNGMLAAIKGEAAATAEPTEATPEATPDEAAPETVAEETHEKPSKEELIAKLQSQIKELEDKGRNTAAMQSEAHRRNTAAAQDRKAAEQALQRAEAALARQESQNRAIVNIAKNMDPELARQFFASLPMDAPQGSHGMPQAPAQENDGLIAQMQKQIDELKQNVSGFAFNVNYGQVAASIERQISSFPVFKDVEKLGELDESVAEIMKRIVAFDTDNPGQINPHDPRSLSKIVRQEVQREAERWKKRSEFTITNYLGQKKKLAEGAPASGKGPSAGVRAAPSDSTHVPAGMAQKDKVDRWTKQWVAISKRPAVTEI